MRPTAVISTTTTYSSGCLNLCVSYKIWRQGFIRVKRRFNGRRILFATYTLKEGRVVVTSEEVDLKWQVSVGITPVKDPHGIV